MTDSAASQLILPSDLSQPGHSSPQMPYAQPAVLSASKLAIGLQHEHWLVALEDITEVLPVPEIIAIPLTQPWLMGMINVRGHLFALTDLGAWMGNPASVLTTESRILLLHDKFAMHAALLIDRVIGLRSQQTMQLQTAQPRWPEWQSAYYLDEDQQNWHLLEISRLIHLPGFNNAALELHG